MDMFDDITFALCVILAAYGLSVLLLDYLQGLILRTKEALIMLKLRS